MYNNNYRLNPDKPYFMEKLVSALSYLTMGFVGFIYLIIVILTKRTFEISYFSINFYFNRLLFINNIRWTNL